MIGPGLALDVVASAPVGRLPRLALIGSLAMHAVGLAWAAHVTDPPVLDPGPVAIEVALVTAAPAAADSPEPALVEAIDRLAVARPGKRIFESDLAPRQADLAPAVDAPPPPARADDAVETQAKPPQDKAAPTQADVAAPPPRPKSRPRAPRETVKAAAAPQLAAAAPDRVRPAAADAPSTVAALAGGGTAAPAATEASRPQSLPAVPTIADGPPVVTTAAYRERPRPPTYPRRAVDLRQQGTAIVRALVGLDGETRDVVLWRSSGVRLLDEAAVAAARDWLFQPARVGGHTIEAWVEIPVHFNLRG